MQNNNKSSLGTRMKEYEEASRILLPKRIPMIIRCDGKAFHTFTKGFEKPWDIEMRDAMTSAASELVEQIQGAKLAYVQSDEISVLITDYDSLEFEPWFNKAVQKTVSVAASMATMAFNRSILWSKGNASACFDARCFVVPREDVGNYFVWRQQDAVRNSIQGLGQKHFSHKELHGVSCSQIQEKLFQERGLNWNDCEIWQKRGWCVIRKSVEIEENVIRSVVEPDWETPEFSKDRTYINKCVFLEENTND